MSRSSQIMNVARKIAGSGGRRTVPAPATLSSQHGRTASRNRSGAPSPSGSTAGRHSQPEVVRSSHGNQSVPSSRHPKRSGSHVRGSHTSAGESTDVRSSHGNPSVSSSRHPGRSGSHPRELHTSTGEPRGEPQVISHDDSISTPPDDVARLEKLQLPKIQPRTPGYVDKSYSAAPFQRELSPVVQFAVWEEFDNIAKHCAKEWREKMPTISAQARRHIEPGFTSACVKLESHKYDSEREISSCAAFTLESLIRIEPLLPKQNSSRGSRSSSGRGSAAREMAAVMYWELLENKHQGFREPGSAGKKEKTNYSAPSAIKPDFGIARRNRGQETVPVANIELKGPHKCLVHNDEHGAMDSARNVAASYNRYFRNPLYTESGNVTDPWYFNTVAQVITAALCTSTGCGGVYTSNKAIFMKVSAHKDALQHKFGHEKRLKVQISRMYDCTGEITPCHGLLALLQSARDAGEEVAASLREAFRIINDKHQRRKEAEQKKKDREKHGETGSSPGGGSVTQGAGGRNDSKHNKIRREKRKNTAGPSDPNALAKVEDTSRRKEHWVFREGSNPRFGRATLIYDVLTNYEYIMAIGGSGMLLRATVDGLPVVVKYWNRMEEEGMIWMENELDIMEYLLETAPDLFGSVLPRIVAIRRLDDPYDSVVVMELVGEELTYVDHKLHVGGVAVPAEEAQMLYETGLSGILKLHAAGVVHRDISSLNLRCAREVDEKGEVRWRVWIIDLGQATRDYGAWEREWDVEGIRACLEPGYFERLREKREREERNSDDNND